MLAKNNWLDAVTGFGAIKVEPLEWLPLEFLCFNMRAIDREEIFGNVATENPLELAAQLHANIAKNGCGWIAKLNGRPAACMGVFENFPGNWQVFSFGTQDYMRVLVAFKPKLDKMIGFGLDNGMHRLECRSLADHHEAHRCIAFIDLQREATLRQYGRDGQDFALFARTWPRKKREAAEQAAPEVGTAGRG